MHGSSRRSAGALLFHAGQERRRQASRHDRGALADRDASGAARLDGSGRAAVRLLPIGAGDERRRASRPQTEAHRRGHRRGDARKSLPLRHVSIGPRGGAARGGAVRRAVMSTRRAFLKTSAAATGGLLIGVYFPDVAGEAVLDAQFGPPGGGAITPHAFIRIGTDDLVTRTSHKPDNGQGTETSIAQISGEAPYHDAARSRSAGPPRPRPQSAVGRTAPPRRPFTRRTTARERKPPSRRFLPKSSTATGRASAPNSRRSTPRSTAARCRARSAASRFARPTIRCAAPARPRATC